MIAIRSDCRVLLWAALLCSQTGCAEPSRNAADAPFTGRGDAAVAAVTGGNKRDDASERAGTGDGGGAISTGQSKPGRTDLDSGQLDSGQPDSGQPDSGQLDTGQPDTGQPETTDAGNLDSDSAQPHDAAPVDGSMAVKCGAGTCAAGERCCDNCADPVCADTCPALCPGMEAEPEELQCIGGTEVVSFDKGCNDVGDCITAIHWTGCCLGVILGLNAAEARAFSDFETACGGPPLCGCCCDYLQAEDGKRVSAAAAFELDCVAGSCTTRAPAGS